MKNQSYNGFTFTHSAMIEVSTGASFPASYETMQDGTIKAHVTMEEGRVMHLAFAPDHEAYAMLREAARDPKQARGSVPAKEFIGITLKGRGFKIVFDGGYDRTRVIFTKLPGPQRRQAVKDAGFYWSPTLKSWNRGLNFKAYRAAQALYNTLQSIA